MDKNWEKIHSTQAWGQYPCEAVIRFVARNFYKSEKRSNVKILDFGCGGGAHTWYLAREGFSTYAFDGSESAINNTRQKLKKDNLYADLSVCEGAEIEYASNFFDAVIDNVCICQNTSQEISLMYAQVYRILKRGGVFFSSVFSTDTTGYGTGDKLEEHTYTNVTKGNLVDLGVCHFFDSNEALKILTETGFTDIVIEPSTYTDNGNVVGHLIMKMKKS